VSTEYETLRISDLIGLIFYYGITITLLHLIPRYLWSRLVAISDDLDKLFVTNSDRRDYIDYVKRYLAQLWQYSWGAVGVLFSLSTVYILRPYLIRITVEGAGFYTLVAILTWLVASVVYWCWSVPQFVRHLYKFRELKLSAIGPAYTPAILSLSRLLGTSSLLAIVGVWSIVMPVLVYVLYFGSKEVFITVSVIASGGMITALFVGVAPQYWLAKIVRRHKEQSLDAIVMSMGGYVAGVPTIFGNKGCEERAFSLLALHKDIQETATFAIRLEVIIKYSLALLSALSPIFALLLKQYIDAHPIF
jgi:hypothetical protein